MACTFYARRSPSQLSHVGFTAATPRVATIGTQPRKTVFRFLVYRPAQRRRTCSAVPSHEETP